MASETYTDAMEDILKEKVDRTAEGAGVYLMKDDLGQVIYVGKAGNLRKRLGSYFKGNGRHDPKTRILVSRIASFETLVTTTEKEALLLESTLIKRYRPRYNVVLKDDKRYPSLRLDVRSSFPNLSIVRKIDKDGAMYFGPFPSAQAVRQTLKIIYQNFKLRKCRHPELRKRNRPCLYCQMQGCLAPCCLDVDPATYHEVVKEVILFLKGRTPDLIDKIRREMAQAAANEEFEKAATLRDRMFALEKTLERQVAVTTDFRDRDALAFARKSHYSCLTLMFIRGGYLLGTRNFNFENSVADDGELISAFIRQYYEKAPTVPEELLVPVAPEEKPLLEEWLRGLHGGPRVRILVPRRGEKVAILKVARQNARNGLREMLDARDTDRSRLLRLQRKLAMDRLPGRIECFDNSNLFGSEPVSSMVVFEAGRFRKSDYRHYRIQAPGGPDDYAHMAEALRRRFGRVPPDPALPDLLLVDGGKGQLNIALAQLRELDLQEAFQVAAVAKKNEKRGEIQDKIYLPGRSNPVIFGKEIDLLLLLQRIRDEAHRFAISFHRRSRRRTSLQSALDAVAGVGPRRKALLLKHFGSIDKLRSAAAAELSALPGIHAKLAESILEQLNRGSEG